MAISEATYIIRQKVIQTRMMKAFYGKVQSALRQQVSEAIRIVKEKGVHAAQGQIHGDVMNTDMIRVMRELYITAVRMAVKKPVVSTKALPSFIVDVIKYLEQYLLSKVVLPISETTIKQIDEVLKQALDNGWGVDETVAHLEDSDLTSYRARMIVRTETVRATNFAQTVAADQSPFETEKRWIAIEDNRTRVSHSHAGVDGEQIDLQDKYSNGLMFPGDPNGSGSETINCRCTQGFFGKRDLEGNLIKKAPGSLTFIQKLGTLQSA